MKQKEIEKLDEINEEKKFDKTLKNKVTRQILNDFWVAIDILLFFIVSMVAARNLSNEIMILIYKVSSVILLFSSLVLFEVAYKKDNGFLWLRAVELLVLAVITLLAPYIFIMKTSFFNQIMGIYFTVYYILKSIIILNKQKNKYLREVSDIQQIIKRESQDELAKKELEEIETNKKAKIKKIEISEENSGTEDIKKVETKKAGRPRKNNVSEAPKKTETKKAGRPRKNNVSEAPKKTETKKPGRPRKNSGTEDTKKVETKKPGRPRKNSLPEDTKSAEKRKPGRPKKVISK